MTFAMGMTTFSMPASDVPSGASTVISNSPWSSFGRNERPTSRAIGQVDANVTTASATMMARCSSDQRTLRV